MQGSNKVVELHAGACADDLAMDVSRYLEDIPSVLVTFEAARLASALPLEIKKCPVLPVDHTADIAEHERRIAQAVPAFACAKVAFAI